LANPQVQNLAITQPTIQVKVDYYSEDEKRKLLAYPTSRMIEAVVNGGVEIPTEEFLAYYLFHRKRPGMPGWQDYNQIAMRIGVAISHLDDWIDFNGQSISCPEEIGHPGIDVVEHIGESIGMSVVGRIHGLTSMDWDHIPEQRGRNALPTFDYEKTSDGHHVIQVESKGSAIADNTILAATVRNHHRNIANKKATINKSTVYAYPADLRYGTITVLGKDAKASVRCLLVDPEPEDSEGRARKLHLVQRMRFLRDWIVFVSPRSQLSAALSTRLAALEELENPFLLDGIPLRKGNGELFGFGPEEFFRRGHSPFFANKSRISDGPAGGITLQLPNGNLFFMGIREDLMALAASQRLGALVEFKTQQGSLTKEVECFFSEGRTRSLFDPELIIQRARQRERGYYSFRVRGRMHYTNSGIVFGVLPLRQ